MKKAFFYDLYGLTDAVIERRKKQTRIIINISETDGKYLDESFDWDLRESVIIDRYSKYKVGEVVAIAQNYKSIIGFKPTHSLFSEKGYKNKMFVKADLMPHQIKVTNIRIEKLQDISDEDCFAEGIVHTFDCGFDGSGRGCDVYHLKGFHYILCDSPREAFYSLIDKINGKGTWERNPYVFVYDFELIN